MADDLGQTAAMTHSTAHQPRRVDHVVLPTADISVARSRLADLGFTVAPAAEHPFGTQNACVYFADNTYLEPLAVKQRETCEAAARAGNVFIMRDQAFRFRRGEDGFSALAMTTVDASGDHQQFADAGISAGQNLSFSRPYMTSADELAEARFELAFAADLRAPDVFFFTCQRVNPLDVDRSVLERHSNGTRGIRQVILSEKNPSDFQYLMQEVCNQREVTAHSFGMDIAAANADIVVLNAAGLKGYFGAEGGAHGRGLRLRGVVFATSAFSTLEKQFQRANIDYLIVGQRLVVPASPGQGAVFAFEKA
jgi:hypothetical protein